MNTPSFKEDHISQIPALQLLIKLGYKYLSPEEAMQLRGNKTTNVILEDILRKQLKEINSEKRISSTKTTYLSDANIENGIRVLKDLPMNEGYIVACETAYNLITLGKSLEQSIDGDKKSFTLQYIDWKNPENNVFHVTEEYSVMRSTSKEHYRPDLVLFVNGIPLCVIECKRPDMKEPLAQAIAMEKTIRNPKIVLVTDRTDLDNQITGTFRKCGMFVENASTGQRLVELLESKSDSVVTTIINKFSAAMKKMSTPLDSHDIIVLVDEGHRTQHGTFNIEMQKALPNACFIAFTGTPLFKKDKSTSEKFGGMIDSYTVDQAVKDKAVVPLLYEGRLAIQEVNEKPLDTFFEMISEPLTDYQKADLKKKFSRADQLNGAEQKIYAIAWNISLHFRDNWQGTPFKAQLVCDRKINAIRYKEFLDEIGIVSSEVLISSMDEREGEDSAYAKSTDKENIFWKKMMDEHGNSKSYEKNIISRQ